MSKYHTKDIQYVKSVTLRVKDIVKMLDFYLNILKFTLIDKQDNRYFLGTSEKEVLLILEENTNARQRGRTTGLYHFAILLPSRVDLGIVLRHLIRIKYPLTGLSDHHVSEAIYLDDPEGNGIEIYHDRPSEAWIINNGSVNMTTERMDYQSVLKDAEASPHFSELPMQTVMGHIHLHVNDLVKADRFFIDILGFAKVLEYRGSATFTSDQMYHHHIAYNTWNGRTNQNMKENDLGLIEYNINLPQERLSALLSRLKSSNIEYIHKQNTIRILDINNTNV